MLLIVIAGLLVLVVFALGDGDTYNRTQRSRRKVQGERDSDADTVTALFTGVVIIVLIYGFMTVGGR